MGKIHLIVLVGILFASGCHHTSRSLSDPRPPLMNTNSFASFQPYTNSILYTNSIDTPDEDLDIQFENAVRNITNR